MLPNNTTKLSSLNFFLDSLKINQLDQLYFMLRLDERKQPESWDKQQYVVELRAAITQAHFKTITKTTIPALVLDQFRKRNS
jgi:beta-lactamase class D